MVLIQDHFNISSGPSGGRNGLRQKKRRKDQSNRRQKVINSRDLVMKRAALTSVGKKIIQTKQVQSTKFSRKNLSCEMIKKSIFS